MDGTIGKLSLQLFGSLEASVKVQRELSFDRTEHVMVV